MLSSNAFCNPVGLLLLVTAQSETNESNSLDVKLVTGHVLCATCGTFDGYN